MENVNRQTEAFRKCSIRGPSPSRPAARLRFLFLIFSLVVVGCAADDGDGSTVDDTGTVDASPSPDAADDSEIEAPESFTILTTDPGSFDSLYPHPILTGNRVYRNVIFDTLVDFSADGDVIPRLLDSWEISEDGVTITMKIRPNVEFHDGTPFTSEIARQNIDFARDPENAVQGAADLQLLEATAPDDETLVLSLVEPLPHLLSFLSLLPMMDLDSDLETAPNGTGPFQVDDFRVRESLHLTRFENYWMENSAIETYIVQLSPDPAQALLTLESGQADAYFAPPISSSGEIENNPQLAILDSPPIGNFQWVANTEVAPLDNPQVRCALSMAFDRERFVEEATFGLTVPTNNIFPPSSPAYEASDETWVYDLDAAEELLSEAGFPDGFELALQVSTGISAEMSQFAPTYQADLAAIGVEATIQEMDTADYVQTFTGGDAAGLIVNTYGFASLDPALIFAAVPFRVEGNAANYESQEYQELEAAGRTESELQARLEIYRELNSLVQESCHAIPVASRAMIVAVDENISGLEVSHYAMVEARNLGR